MSAIVFENEVVHYEVLGRGRPILFLHGWVGSWRYWIPTMQAVSTGYRSYALDLWGFGDTAKQAAHYRIEDQTVLLHGWIEKMGIMRIALVGHGLGAEIALQFTLKNPDLVDRVMLVQYPFSNEMISNRLSSDPPSSLADWLVDRNRVDHSLFTEAGRTDPLAIRQSLADLKAMAQNHWREIAKPCLFVSSTNDPAMEKLKDSDLQPVPDHIHAIWFDNSGHFPMIDEDNKFNRLLLDFLSLKSNESPQQLQLRDQWIRRVR